MLELFLELLICTSHFCMSECWVIQGITLRFQCTVAKCSAIQSLHSAMLQSFLLQMSARESCSNYISAVARQMKNICLLVQNINLNLKHFTAVFYT